MEFWKKDIDIIRKFVVVLKLYILVFKFCYCLLLIIEVDFWLKVVGVMLFFVVNRVGN